MNRSKTNEMSKEKSHFTKRKIKEKLKARNCISSTYTVVNHNQSMVKLSSEFLSIKVFFFFFAQK